MNEKVLNGKKNGMSVLLLILLVYIIGIAMIILSGISLDQAPGAMNIAGLVIGILIVAFGWIFLLGLKVLKPQEALVLTLFGKYVGTLKENGFYYVNPFCVGVNPAARTRLSQSGDVSEPGTGLTALVNGVQSANAMTSGLWIRQKRFSMWTITRNSCPSSVTAPCAMWSASILTMWRQMWTPQGTALRMREAYVVPAR